MSETAPIRWGIVSTANIARAQFLPALRAAGDVAQVVGSRDAARAEAWAAQHGIARGVGSYQAVVEAPDVDAVYVALPNSLHAEWATAALRAGKAVLCEKPLCVSVEQTEALLGVARETESLLWEAFVFPFHAQMERFHALVGEGTLGELREIQSNFFFMLRNRQNIRLSRVMYGGAMNDVGCYPIRMAQLIFDAVPDEAVALSTWAPEGVDEETQAVLNYSGNRRLTLACGLNHLYDTFTRVRGTEGEIRFSNPFHPGLQDTLEIHRAGTVTIEHPTGAEPSFTAAIRHIHAVLRGDEPPRHLATEDSLATAQALELLHQRMGG
jgi:predicted dehydrogenase